MTTNTKNKELMKVKGESQNKEKERKKISRMNNKE